MQFAVQPPVIVVWPLTVIPLVRLTPVIQMNVPAGNVIVSPSCATRRTIRVQLRANRQTIKNIRFLEPARVFACFDHFASIALRPLSDRGNAKGLRKCSRLVAS